MSVDISPKRPPISSCTACAPAGSGSDGGGSSVAQRSKRKIISGHPTRGGRRLPSGLVLDRGGSGMWPLDAHGDREARGRAAPAEEDLAVPAPARRLRAPRELERG